MNYYPYNNDTFVGMYITDYNQVLNTPCPMDGSAMLFANLSSNMLYSKKMINGQAYIQGYTISPIIADTPHDDTLKDILARLDKLEGKANEH